LNLRVVKKSERAIFEQIPATTGSVPLAAMAAFAGTSLVEKSERLNCNETRTLWQDRV